MKKTEHYQLSQWERADRILMEDFNGDNARIDAALAALAALSASESGRLDAALAESEQRSAKALSDAQAALKADVKRLESGKLSFAVLLEKTVPAAGGSTLDLPVSGSLLSQCVLAAVDIQLPYGGKCYIGVNGDQGTYWAPGYSSGTSNGALALLSAGQTSRLLFFPMKRSASPITSFMAGGGLYLGYTTSSYGSLRHLQLREMNGNTLSGSVGLRVTGVM